MKVYGGVDVYIRIFLTLALAGGEWSASCPSCFSPWKLPLVPSGYEAWWDPELVWTT
jgi:hypothetical protein